MSTLTTFPDGPPIKNTYILGVGPSKQTPLWSAIETLVQLLVGILIAQFIWLYGLGPVIAPDLDTWQDGVAVNLPFLVASLIRGYIIRRAFVCSGKG